MRHLWILAALVGCEVSAPDPDLRPFDQLEITLPADCELDVEPLTGACSPQRLACGDLRFGTTAGGHNRFNLQSFSDMACLGSISSANDLEGPEAVYMLDLAPGQYADVLIDDRCGHFALRAFNTDKVCNDQPQNCTSSREEDGGQRLLSLNGGVDGERWEILVDGANQEGAPFTIKVDCRAD